MPCWNRVALCILNHCQQELSDITKKQTYLEMKAIGQKKKKQPKKQAAVY